MAQSDPMTSWLEAAAGLYGAAVTISLRTLRLQQGLLTGRAFSDPENSRMVFEKLAAAGEGAADGAAAWWRLVNANPLSPHVVAKRANEAFYAPTKAGLRTARANARRLSRR